MGQDDFQIAHKAKYFDAFLRTMTNGAFAAGFISYFMFPQEQCYATGTLDVHVEAGTPGAQNITLYYNTSLAIGSILYFFQTIAALSLIAAGPFTDKIAKVEVALRPIMYVFFIWIHIVRFSHSGKVCGGTYLAPGASTEGYLCSLQEFITFYIILGWCVVPITLILLVLYKGQQVGLHVLRIPK